MRRRTPGTSRVARSFVRLSLGFALLAVGAACLATAIAPQQALAAHPAPGEPFSMDFPRLGMWWPDGSHSDPAAVARYDYVVLADGWASSGRIDTLRSLNPAQTLLTSTDIASVSFQPDAPANDEPNLEFARLPAAWLLTQCGSTLRTSVDANVTTLPVNEVVTRDSEGKSITLFETGDLVVVGDEVMRVEAVDATARSLRVSRGRVHAATAHVAGTRAAATIRTWPGSLMMDVSTNCPSWTVDRTSAPRRGGRTAHASTPRALTIAGGTGCS